MTLNQTLLDSYLGKSMAEICTNGYTANNINHCAHFVSHVLQLDFGMTCDKLVAGAGDSGANVRVQEIFTHSSNVKELTYCPTAAKCLVFVSEESNFTGSPVRLRNVPRKHIGIGFGSQVWHYSNSANEVVKQPIHAFLQHYRNQTNAVWIGDIPAGARPRPLKREGATSGL